MKKIFAILMTICLLAGALSITAFAADELPAPAEGTVIRVTARDKKTAEDVLIQDYTKFDEGWEGAIDFALSETERAKYSRVIVDFYGDWTADEDGVFGDSWRLSSNWGDGFQYSTIYVPENVNITLNLNGHTIDRDLEESENDGEVIYIDEGADVIINNGTIKGGKSENGAGGIHVNEAYLTLNNVHIVGNLADNDDGGGIALYDSTLVMNGGSFRDNVIDGTEASGVGAWECMGGAIYINDSTATFKGVEFKNNQNTTNSDYGAAIYVDDGKVSIDNCTFDGNGIKDDAKGFKPSLSIIHAEGGSTIDVKNSTFTNNGYNAHNWQWGYLGGGTYGYSSSMFTLEGSKLTISGDTKFTNNATVEMFYIYHGTSSVYISDATFTDNGSDIIYAHRNLAEDSYFRNCTFNNNQMTKPELFYSFTGGTYSSISFNISDCSLTMYECDMGNSTYKGLENIKFVNCENAPENNPYSGSVFGEGSLTMIVAFVALIASVASIIVNVTARKKKTVPVTATEQSEDDE